MTRAQRIPESSAPFLLGDRYRAWGRRIFGVHIVLEPSKRNAGHAHNAGKGDALEQQLVNRLFGIVTDSALGGLDHELTTALLALPFRLAVTNRAVLDKLCALACRTLHDSTSLPISGITTGNYTSTTSA